MAEKLPFEKVLVQPNIRLSCCKIIGQVGQPTFHNLQGPLVILELHFLFSSDRQS